jgi:type IV pilus assembly protein PilB
MAENYLLIPIKKEEKGLLVAMANPLEPHALDDLRFVTQMPIYIGVAPQTDILDAIERYYPMQDFEKYLYTNLDIDRLISPHPRNLKEKDIQDISKSAENAPIVQFINILLAEAIRLKASDVYIEPQVNIVIIRYLIDGIMREIMQIDKHVHSSIVSRIKIISNMDISIRRKPQDGRANIQYRDKTYDLRISSLPILYGEKITIRLLNPDMSKIGIKDLGFSDNDLNNFVKAISTPQGIIIVTGPAGSGKSTTLYASLNRLNAPDINIITVEDPIEYDIDGINQVQINPKAGITFASELRSILKQDPDIVLVGKIEDSETAAIAFQAAQTGHLVLTTLHTNDAPSALLRLTDLGIDNLLITDALIAVVGQRLIRKICQECKIPDSLSPQILKRLPPNMVEDKSVTFWKGAGCEACQYTGYSGRLGLFEIMMITPSLKEVIKPDTSAYTLKKVAESGGFQSMAMDGMKKALQGLTTVEEVFRVAPPELQEPITELSLQEEIGTEKPILDELPALVKSVKPVKILVANDNPVVVKMLCNILEAENYHVIIAKNSLEAMKLSLHERPDLIVTDFRLPKTDVLTFIKKLRSHLTTRYIPTIKLIEKNVVDSEVEAIDSRADDYIPTSISSKKLLSKISRILRKL